MTCEVTLVASGHCQVHVVPQWDGASAHVESAGNAVSALWRHAQIAMQLREAGWALVSRSSS